MKKLFVSLAICILALATLSPAAFAQETSPQDGSSPDQFVAPIDLNTNVNEPVTQADIAVIQAKFPKAYYSYPGGNRDGTRNDEREGMDFGFREQQPWEFFACDVRALLCGGCTFTDDGTLYFAPTGEIMEEFKCKTRILDTWTIDWFDAHDTEYLHLNTRRSSINLIHPPESALPYVEEVMAAMVEADDSNWYHYEDWQIDEDAHHENGTQYVSWGNPTCACGRPIVH